MAVLKPVISKSYSDDLAIRNLIGYAVWDDKNQRYFPYGGRNIFRYNLQSMINEFEYTQSLFGKSEGRRVRHYIISFDKSECIIPYDALEIAWQISNFFANDYQVAYGIHTNTDKIHIHIIVNTVSFRTGLKLTNEYDVVREFFRHTEKILQLYGVPLWLKYDRNNNLDL